MTTYRLSNRVNSMAESETIKMAAMARELQSKGIDVINLSLGEPDFDTPQHIKDAAERAIEEGYTRYTPVAGYLDLREAIVAKLKRDNNLDYTPAQIVVSTGAKQSIANVVLSLINPGDEVILPIPYWVSYEAQIELAEGIPVKVPTRLENKFKMTASELAAAITPKTRLLIFSSPCNPTGSVYDKAELKALAEVVAQHPDLYIVADEIYEYINFVGKHESIAQFDFIKDRVITVNGLSKGFAMTGWRLGYIAAPLPIAKACDKMQGQFTSGTCSITQRAAITALTGSLTTAHAMCEAFLHRRDLVLEWLNEIPGIKTYVPDGAFYVFPDVSAYLNTTTDGYTIQTAEELCMYLIKEAHVSLVSGEAFGIKGCFRISYAASEDKLRKAGERIKVALARLRPL